ncbi:hypothetical protein ACPOL_2796 [Acidisarcina polymorpha]|uniref:Uncharacterized protein n=1 Tax=Acidisarcina polymorpha TaxID=2211140 RepID=A0A2Z5G008_9BACT|nr:hypothetical protein ACPOL_2796 [Acidisarcina polymorpha]
MWDGSGTGGFEFSVSPDPFVVTVAPQGELGGVVAAHSVNSAPPPGGV